MDGSPSIKLKAVDTGFVCTCLWLEVKKRFRGMEIIQDSRVCPMGTEESVRRDIKVLFPEPVRPISTIAISSISSVLVRLSLIKVLYTTDIDLTRQEQDLNF
jgi:hypothetical protein